MEKLKNKSKGETLIFLKKKFKFLNIPKSLIFNASSFSVNKKNFLNLISKNFSTSIAIRSSNKNEDTLNYSNAGKFESVLNVNSQNDKELSDAILKVINSYKK